MLRGEPSNSVALGSAAYFHLVQGHGETGVWNSISSELVKKLPSTRSLDFSFSVAVSFAARADLSRSIRGSAGLIGEETQQSR